eukprot:gnl/Carplike_NY0171/6898_a9502_246.p1 GENE.gnl/Carplike_NY0171/6898_a9502_246~~gnl/Carplike_NY0171/6898_a9502_246.p1  ORF type:complete len:252 (+),score=48.95 gnl/Carplike_NY0171/6898_a9502_246:101-757(+)
MTGTLAQYQEITLVNREEKPVHLCLDDKATLASIKAEDGFTLSVRDTNMFSLARHGGLTDLSKVKKYEMSDADYDKREGTVRDRHRKRMASDPEYRAEVLAKQKAREELRNSWKKECEAIEIGSRCEIFPGGCRGTVLYRGRVIGLELGWWLGIGLDEPTTKHDGTCEGKRYFTCEPNCGLFMRPDPDFIKIGDFPPTLDEELDALMKEMDEESESEL